MFTRCRSAGVQDRASRWAQPGRCPERDDQEIARDVLISVSLGPSWRSFVREASSKVGWLDDLLNVDIGCAG